MERGEQTEGFIEYGPDYSVVSLMTVPPPAQPRTVFQLANVLESGRAVRTKRVYHFPPNASKDLGVLGEHIDGVSQERRRLRTTIS